MKIGIIGIGFVGGAVKKYFSAKGGNIFVYDKFKHIGSIEEINRADVVFICVPTPFHTKKGFDVSAVVDAIKILKEPKIVVIKSSIIPGTAEKLQKQFPQHKILFNPEFLREASAFGDMIRPERQIIGYTKNSRNAAQAVMNLLPKAPFQKIMPALEAEAVKYMANAFLALRVVFANEFYDICKKLGAGYNLVQQAVGQDHRIGHSHFNVTDGGYRGYGGSCFPKDVNAIIELASSKSIKVELLKAMRNINRKYLHQSGLTEEYFLKNLHKKKK